MKRWYLCHECGNVWDVYPADCTCPSCGNHKNTWDITDMPDYHHLIKRAEQDGAERHKQEVNDAIQMVRENPPPLECPHCGCDENDCVQDKFVCSDLLDDGDATKIVYDCICPNCGGRFTETFYRVLIEKVGD